MRSTSSAGRVQPVSGIFCAFSSVRCEACRRPSTAARGRPAVDERTGVLISLPARGRRLAPQPCRAIALPGAAVSREAVLVAGRYCADHAASIGAVVFFSLGTGILMGLCRVIVEARNLIEEARTLVEVAREELPPTAQAVRRASAEAGEATAELRALRTLGGDLALKLTASAQAVVEADAGLRSALRAVRSRMRRVMGQAEVGGDSRGGGVWDAGVAPDQAAGAEGDSAACGRAEDADSSSSEEAQRAAGLADLAPRDVAEVIAAGLSSVRDVAAIFTQTSGLSAARAFADGFGLGKKGGGGARDDE